MRRECVVDSSVGDGLGFLIAAPSILFGTMAVTGVLFALTVSLVQRAWSVYAAIGAAVLAAAVVVAVAVSYVYDTGTANDSLPERNSPFRVAVTGVRECTQEHQRLMQ